MKKIIDYYDRKNFGNRIHVFDNGNNYFCIMLDRGETTYAFISHDLKRFYPVDSIIRNRNFNYDFQSNAEKMDIPLEIDLSKLGYSECSSFLVDLINNK